MTIQLIDTTSGAGDTGKAGGDKINAMMTELYAAGAAGREFYSFKSSQINKLRQGLSKVITGLGGMKFVAAGDSTTAGVTGGTGAVGTKSSWPYYFYRELVRRGIPARYDSLCYGQTIGDARLTVGAGWANFGGYMFAAPTNLTSPLTFVPDSQCDRVEIYYLDSAAGTLRVQWNSETVVDTTLTGNGALKKITVNASALGANTLNIFMNAGYMFLADCYASTVKDVRVINMGFGGLQAAVSAVAYSIEKLWAFVQADAYHLNLGINNYGLNDPSGYLAAMTTIATALQVQGDLVLDNPTPNIQSDAVQDSYFTQLKSLADTKGCALLDLRARYGATQAIASANGWVTATPHPTIYCYEDQGRWKAGLYLGRP